MDRNSVLILIICALLFLLWAQLTPKLYPPRPMPATNALAGTSSNGLVNVSNAPTTPAPSLETSTVAPAGAPQPLAPEEILVVTNETGRYTFTSHGGGLKQVELLKYPESVHCGRRPGNGGQKLATLNEDAQQPVLALLGGPGLTGDGTFKLSRVGTSGVRAEKELPEGGYLVKDFQL